jgi:hypothetical protein
MLLVVWVAAGWGSALLAAPRLRDWLVEYRSRTTGPSYGLANDAASVVAAELGTRERMAELLGAPAADLDESKLCRLTWMDREKTYVHAQRASRARPAYGLLGVTAAGRAALGLYAVDLWSGNCAGQTEFYDRDCTKVGQVRLIERRELLEAKAGAEAKTPAPLLAGQCVWRKLSGKAGVVGRFQVQLPAEREITVRAFVLPPSAFLSYRLMFAGREAEHARGESTVFQSLGEGDYELEVALQPAADGQETPGEYTLQVHWGQGAGEACPVPSFDERECYGVEIGKGEGE